MKPTIFEITQPKGKPHAILVDADKVTTLPDERGITRMHFTRCVLIGPCEAGDIGRDEKSGKVIFPRPAVIQVHKRGGMEEIKLVDRRLTEKTAVVLLDLAAAANNVTTNDTKETFRLGKPVSEKVPNGWCEWKFLAAWCWESWLLDGDKPAAMHKDMVQLGYTKKAGAFRQMMHRMGFVTRSKSSKSQST